MTSANENGLNCMRPLNLSTTDNAAAGAENVFFEMMDPNRATGSDLCEIPAQLEEILKNVYDISTNDRDFNPVLNSTMGSNDSRVFEPSSTSATNNFSVNFSSDTSLYVTPNDNNALASSVYFTPNVLAHNSNFQPNPSFIYNRPENCENFAELMLDQKAYNNASAATNAQEDDNDSSPVYLNFNIQNMAQSVQTFNTEFEKYTHQANCTSNTEKKNSEINYVEYMNNIEEAWQPQLVEVNAQRDQIFRQIPTNIMQTTLKKIPMQKIYSFPHEIEKLNGAYGVEIMSQFQSLNNNAIVANYTESPQQNPPNVERQIISRNPLHTRQSLKINNSEWAIINDKTSNKNNQNLEDIDDSELLAIDQTDPDIPFIKERTSERKRRKQSLIPLGDNDISFMNNKGEFSKFEESKDLAVKEIKFPIDTSYVTFRKKQKTNASNDNLVDSLSSAGRNNSSIQSTSRDSVVNISSTSSAIIVSSDSDSEEDLDSADPKCLKCNNCKKMFKTSRSYSIHKKRCDVPCNSDNTYVIEVEYLDSEKEEDVDDLCDTETKEAKFMDESVEIIESDSIESIEILKQEALDEPERTDENIVRRNTRSSSLKNGTISSTSLPTLSSPSKLSLKKSTKKSCSEGKQTMPTCEVCGKTFRQKSYLIAHKRIHEKNFKCQYCLKTFLVKMAYDTHVLEKCEKIPSVKLKRLRSTVTNTNSK